MIQNGETWNGVKVWALLTSGSTLLHNCQSMRRAISETRDMTDQSLLDIRTQGRGVLFHGDRHACVQKHGNTLFYPNLSYDFHDHSLQCNEELSLC